MAYQSPQPTHTESDRQPRLVPPVWPGNCFDCRQFRRNGRPAIKPGVARPSRDALRPRRVVDQAACASGRLESGLSARIEGHSQASGRRPGESARLATQPAPAGCGGAARRDACDVRRFESPTAEGSPIEQLKMVEIRDNGPEARAIIEKADASTLRSVYLPLLRGITPRPLEAFDPVDQTLVTGQRQVTTVPGQALYLLNSPSFAARALSSPRGFSRSTRPTTNAPGAIRDSARREDRRPTRSREAGRFSPSTRWHKPSWTRPRSVGATKVSARPAKQWRPQRRRGHRRTPMRATKRRADHGTRHSSTGCPHRSLARACPSGLRHGRVSLCQVIFTPSSL